MVDFTHEMADLMSALGRPEKRLGRAFMFVSALSGEGVSSLAREFSRCEAAFAKKPVWLIDADLSQQTQLQAILDEPERYGPAGEVSRASPDHNAFFTVSPHVKGPKGGILNDSAYLVARPFLNNKLWVSRFRQKHLSQGQRVKMADNGAYWDNLRSFAQTVVVDAPALDRSGIALSLAPYMDGIFIIISEGMGDVQTRLDLKNDIEQVGGSCLGVIYNRAKKIKQRSQTKRRLVRS